MVEAMNIKRLTARVWPVSAIASADAGDNHPEKDGARKHPEHIAIAEEYSRAGGLLTEMAKQPLPPAIAAQIPSSTKVTISDAGREANAIDAQIQDGPADQTRLYHLIARYPLW